EIASIIGHELAHFSGEDTTYIQQFTPIFPPPFARSKNLAARPLSKGCRIHTRCLAEFHESVKRQSQNSTAITQSSRR
ncbi:hypothetical protein ACC772_39990, partial [Rhizobium ruizarguesonis]